MSTLAPMLEAFFTDRLQQQRHASPHTVVAYRDTFRLLLAFAKDETRKAPSDLTPTEEKIARLAAEGFTNREVAERAFVSAKTVEANLARVYDKLGLRSRAELGRVPDNDTWVQWSGTVHVAKGDHFLTVRATDRSGYTQTAVRVDVVPNGATGWDRVEFTAG